MAEYKQPFISIAKVRAVVWAKTDGSCWYCGKQTNPWIDFCIDHIIPGIEQLRSYLLQREGVNNGEGCFTFYFEKRELTP